MESRETPPSIPNLRRQRPSVDYIDNHLPDRHEAFRSHGSQYNPDLGCYVPAPVLTVAVDDSSGPVDLHCSPVSDGDDQSEDSDESPLARGLPPAIEVMKFWGLIFEDSLKKFKSDYPAPKGRSETDFDIRNAAGWNTVYSKLQLAREAYDGPKNGFWGRIKNPHRKIADHAAGITRVAKFIPEGSFTSPVRAAVDVLLDALNVSAEVRQATTRSFDSQALGRVFGNVEVFLSTFPEDENIKKSSIELVVAIFKAIEDTIGFFIQPSTTRGRSAVIHGEKYQELLLESIGQMSSCSSYLADQANNAHLVTARKGFSGMQRHMRQSKRLQRQTNKELKGIKGEAKDSNAHLLNRMQDLLDDGEKTREIVLEQKALVEQLQQELMSSRLTPSPQPPMHWTPLCPLPQTSMQLLPSPAPQSQLPWVVPAPASVQTLIVPMPIQLQPFRFTQHAMQPRPATPIDQNTLHELLGIARIDEADINQILESSELVPTRYRNRAEQVANSPQFRDWIVTATSRELLVSGERSLARNDTSALSLLFATMMSSVRKRTRHLGLVFFCGRHAAEDDDYAGPNAMIRSLTSQLLRYHFFDTTVLRRDIDMDGVRAGDIRAHCALFGWLVRQLPRPVTLVCLIDDMSSYDSDEYEADMLIVLGSLLSLARDDHLSPAFKILATSPLSTERMQKLFREDDSCHLSIEELPRVVHGTGSDLRPQGQSDSELEESTDSESVSEPESEDGTDQSD